MDKPGVVWSNLTTREYGSSDETLGHLALGLFSEIFSWWGGNTWGTRWTIWKTSKLVGEDEFGNRYYLQKKGTGPLGVPRRFVVYKDLADASKVPPEWHGWLHHRTDTPPSKEDYKAHEWETPHVPNLTGSSAAYRPKGSMANPQDRQKVTGDYDAWTPGN